MMAALVSRDNDVIGEVRHAPKSGRTIDVAGAFTIGGDAVNVRRFKISRSKRNLEKAKSQPAVIRVETNHSPVYVFDM